MIKAPYTFVPVSIGNNDSPLFKPVFHDGNNNDKEKLLTGELHCSLDCLTPLIAGHFQYQLQHRDDVKKTDKELTLNPEWGEIKVGGEGFDQDKSFLEPLFLKGKPESPMLISGTALKGMIRHNIGAMLSAPMERVKEQFFSYRPNITVAQGRYEPREAVIREIDIERNILIVDILPSGRHAHFLAKSVYDQLGKDYGAICPISDIASANLCKSNFTNKKGKTIEKERIISPHSKTPNSTLLPDYSKFQVLKYKAGLDGEGKIAKTHKQPNGKSGRQKDDIAVIVSTDILDSPYFAEQVIEPTIIQQFLKTKQELADKSSGHVSRNSDIAPYTNGLKNHNLDTGQLIYVEINDSDNVVSFGHNFRYRWRYADSIHKVQDSTTGNRIIDRPEITSPEDESVTGSEQDKLTAARLLFGYVDGGEEGKSDDLNLGIGKKEHPDYYRLAGRISINTAIEQIEGKTLNERFVQRKDANTDTLHRFIIPLKILGAPKASAVEHYLQQSGNNLSTYGDLPGVEVSGTALNGRKFYRHQPLSNDYIETAPEIIKKNQSSFTQFISREGSQFKFAVRFKDLRKWELAALMLALKPDLISEGTANKLGHGRPLGLGSVRIEIDAIQLLNTETGELKAATTIIDDKETFVTDNLYGEAEIISKKQIDHWLDVLNFDTSSKAAYPTKKVRGETTIYAYHSDIRATYSKNRRSKNGKMDKNYGEPVEP